jgi:hypothetical protein
MATPAWFCGAAVATTQPLGAAHKLKPPTLPGDNYIHARLKNLNSWDSRQRINSERPYPVQPTSNRHER